MQGYSIVQLHSQHYDQGITTRYNPTQLFPQAVTDCMTGPFRTESSIIDANSQFKLLLMISNNNDLTS